MSEFSRRAFFAIVSALIPNLVAKSAEAATSKKPSPTPKRKKPSSPKKKPSPTPSPRKSTPTPYPTASSSSSPNAKASPGATLAGIYIAKSSELTLRQSKIFFVKDSFGISAGYSLTRTSRGVVAFDVKCTHAGAPTTLRNSRLECPAHGSVFDPESGQVTRGPALSPLKQYETVESDGEIRILIS